MRQILPNSENFITTTTSTGTISETGTWINIPSSPSIYSSGTSTTTSSQPVMMEGHVTMPDTEEVYEDLPEEEPVKVKKPRKSKPVPDYSYVAPEVDALSPEVGMMMCVDTSWQNRRDEYHRINNITSLYVNMIPLSYVLDFRRIYANFNRNFYYSRVFEVRMSKFNSINRAKLNMVISGTDNGMLSTAYKSYVSNDVCNTVSDTMTRDIVNKFDSYLKEDMLADMTYNNIRSSCRLDRVQQFMFGEGTIARGRTFGAMITNLSVFMTNRPWNNEYDPYIMAVVLPENYEYQKWYILRHGKVDMSKVIILIDKDLDSTAFPLPAFRTFYRRQLLPYYKTLGVDIWKVPNSFIRENCFHNGFEFTGTSIMDIEEETENMKATFCSMFNLDSATVDEEYEETYRRMQERREDAEMSEGEYSEDDEEYNDEEYDEDQD